MNSMDLNGSRSFSAAKVAYYCFVYIGANETGMWGQCASVLGLSEREADMIANIGKLLDTMGGLEYRLAQGVFDGDSAVPADLKYLGRKTYEDAIYACVNLGIGLDSLVTFWNKKLHSLSGGFVFNRIVTGQHR